MPSETKPEATREADAILDSMVRDFCKVGPLPKSEVRRRLLEWRAGAESSADALNELRMIDEALARRPALTAVKDRYSKVCMACEAASRGDKAEAALEQAREALRKYGQHSRSCTKPVPFGRVCDCGFEAALASPTTTEKGT